MTSIIAKLSVMSCRGMDLPSAALAMATRCSALSMPPPRPMSSSSIGGFRIFQALTCYPNCAGAA
jgi:hypothetical protein